jgi:hypothetical protein
MSASELRRLSRRRRCRRRRRPMPSIIPTSDHRGVLPLKKIGESSLNENAINYFAEIDLVAFSPSR